MQQLLIMSNRRTTIKSGSAKRRPRRQLLIIYGALILFGIVLLIVGQSSMGRRPNVPPRNATPRKTADREPAANRSQQTTTAVESPTDRITLIDDDGQTLWASPTDGPPIDVAYLPSGMQFIVALRWNMPHRERIKIVWALGPFGERGFRHLADSVFAAGARDMYGLPPMVIGLQSDTAGNWLMSRVAYYPKPFTEERSSELLEILSDQGKRTYAGRSYGITGKFACYVPVPPHTDRIVIAPETLIPEIIDLSGYAPPLRRDMERLLAHTDADRHFTILFAPNALFSQSESVFSGQMSRLREALFWFLGDEFSAVAVSLHWDKNFFVEFIAVPTLDTSPEHASRVLTERLAQVPDKLEEYMAALNPQPYGREIVARLPKMLRTLVAYTRSGFERDHVVLRCFLPLMAGENLLMGAELTLAEQPGAARMVAEATAPSQALNEAPVSVQENLKRTISLRFARDTLEAALAQLSQDMGVAIVIRGPDLESDGITKNQSFGIDLANKPAEDVLIEILRLANPDKTASGPNDVKQKLVYVIGIGDDGKEQIIVTTRAAAASRGEALPAAFQVANP